MFSGYFLLLKGFTMKDHEKLEALENAFTEEDIENLPVDDLLNSMADVLGQDRSEFRNRYRNIKEGII
jgi:hypothetical protein